MSMAHKALPISQVAQLIGVEERTIRNWTKEREGRPLLKSEDDGSLVVPAEAYEFGLKHSPRSRGLQAPPGYRDAAAPQAPAPASIYEFEIAPEILRVLKGRDPFTFDAEELNRILAIGGVPEGMVRVLVQSVRAQQNRRSIELRAGKTFTSDEVTKMLRAHAELLVTEVDVRAPEFAQYLLRLLRTQFNFDMAAKTPSAQDILEAQIRDGFGNAIIRQIRKQVEDQVNGVASLELHA